MSTVSDVANREWSADEGPLGPRDERYRTRMRDAYGELTLRLLGAGVPEVVWVVPPAPTAECRYPSTCAAMRTFQRWTGRSAR
jgi:hypothetical protein